MRQRAYLVSKYVWGDSLVEVGNPPYYEVTNAVTGEVMGMRDDYFINTYVHSLYGLGRTNSVLGAQGWLPIVDDASGYNFIWRKPGSTDVVTPIDLLTYGADAHEMASILGALSVVNAPMS